MLSYLYQIYQIYTIFKESDKHPLITLKNPSNIDYKNNKIINFVLKKSNNAHVIEGKSKLCILIICIHIGHGNVFMSGLVCKIRWDISEIKSEIIFILFSWRYVV